MLWYGLSKRGIAVAYQKTVVFSGYKVQIIFAPALKYGGLDTRSLKNDPKIVFPKPVTIFSEDGWPTETVEIPTYALEPRIYYGVKSVEVVTVDPIIRTFTDRFAVTGNGVVIDLMEDFRQIRLLKARIEENFGSERYGCTGRLWTNDPVNIRGVRLRKIELCDSLDLEI